MSHSLPAMWSQRLRSRFVFYGERDELYAKQLSDCSEVWPDVLSSRSCFSFCLFSNILPIV